MINESFCIFIFLKNLTVTFFCNDAIIHKTNADWSGKRFVRLLFGGQIRSGHNKREEPDMIPKKSRAWTKTLCCAMSGRANADKSGWICQNLIHNLPNEA